MTETIYAWQLETGHIIQQKNGVCRTVTLAVVNMDDPDFVIVEWDNGERNRYTFLDQFVRVDPISLPQTHPAPPPVPSADAPKYTDEAVFNTVAVLRERFHDTTNFGDFGKVRTEMLFAAIEHLTAANDALQAEVAKRDEWARVAKGWIPGDDDEVDYADNAPPSASAATADAPVMTANNVMPLSEWNNIVAGANSYDASDKNPQVAMKQCVRCDAKRPDLSERGLCPSCEYATSGKAGEE